MDGFRLTGALIKRAPIVACVAVFCYHPEKQMLWLWLRTGKMVVAEDRYATIAGVVCIFKQCQHHLHLRVKVSGYLGCGAPLFWWDGHGNVWLKNYQHCVI